MQLASDVVRQTAAFSPQADNAFTVFISRPDNEATFPGMSPESAVKEVFSDYYNGILPQTVKQVNENKMKFTSATIIP